MDFIQVGYKKKQLELIYKRSSFLEKKDIYLFRNLLYKDLYKGL